MTKAYVIMYSCLVCGEPWQEPIYVYTNPQKASDYCDKLNSLLNDVITRYDFRVQTYEKYFYNSKEYQELKKHCGYISHDHDCKVFCLTEVEMDV